VEDGLLVLLLRLVAVGRGTPRGEVLDLEDPYPVLLGDGEYRESSRSAAQ
jgi:hypothetical protein